MTIDTLIFTLPASPSTQPQSAARMRSRKRGRRASFLKGIDTQRMIDYLLAVQASRRTGTPAKA